MEKEIMTEPAFMWTNPEFLKKQISEVTQEEIDKIKNKIKIAASMDWIKNYFSPIAPVFDGNQKLIGCGDFQENLHYCDGCQICMKGKCKTYNENMEFLEKNDPVQIKEDQIKVAQEIMQEEDNKIFDILMKNMNENQVNGEEIHQDIFGNVYDVEQNETNQPDMQKWTKQFTPKYDTNHIITGYVAYEEVGFGVIDMTPEANDAINKSHGIKMEKAKEIESLDDTCKKIYSTFRYQFPWMFGFLLLSDGKKEYIHQIFKSLPAFSVEHINNSIVFYSKWDGTNIDKFWFSKKEETDGLEDGLEEIFGTKKTNRQVEYKDLEPAGVKGYYYGGKKKWTSKLEKAKYGEKPNKYIGSNKIILSNPESVEIYEWGFRISTPLISMVAIKNTYYEHGVFNSKNISDELLHMVPYDEQEGVSYSLPEKAMDIRLMRYYWNQTSDTDKNDKFNEVLFPDHIDDILDIGQHDYDMVDLD